MSAAKALRAALEPGAPEALRTSAELLIAMAIADTPTLNAAAVRLGVSVRTLHRLRAALVQAGP